MIKSHKDFIKHKKIAQEVTSDKKVLERFDVLFLHGYIDAAVLDSIDMPSVMVQHGAARDYTYNFSRLLDIADSTIEWSLRKDREKILSEIQKLFRKPDVLLSNSEFSQQQLQEWFGLDSEVVHPPTDREKFRPMSGEGDYFFTAQRLHWVKRPDIYLKAFQDLDETLKIAGDGKYRNLVKAYDKKYDNIHYVGYLNDIELRKQYSQAKAVIHTGEKDELPNAPRESLACGTPVIGLEGGGMDEIISEGKHGVLFSSDDPSTRLKEAVTAFDTREYDESVLRAATERYDKEKIMGDLRGYARQAVEKHSQSGIESE